MTDPGSPRTMSEADRADREAVIEPPTTATAGDAEPVGAGVPEADALDQQLAARPGEVGRPQRPLGERDASEADVLDQQSEVAVDEDDDEL